MKKILVVGLLLFPGFLFAQDDEPEINVAGVRFLNFSNNLPDNLLTSKAVVLMQLPAQSATSSIRKDWKPMAESAHDVFKQVGVDAVAYYFMDDVISGREPREAFAKDMKDREIEILIIISDVKLKIKNKETERYVIFITAFNGETSLMDNGQAAWKTQNKDLDKGLDKLRKGASKQRLVNENLLIVDYPEIVRDLDVIKGRRAETYSNSLNIDKVAFTKFPTADIPDQRPGGMINNAIAKEGEASNAAAASKNRKLDQLLQSYPFGYTLTEAEADEQALLNQGYSYVIYLLNTTGMGVRYMLDYEIEEGVSDFITVKQKGGKTTLRNIPTEAPIYKYYLKHLRTKDVYVGSRWDADESWEEALDNFISNIKKDFR